MRNLKPIWNTVQLVWFGLWLSSNLTSLFIYSDTIGSYFEIGNTVCTYSGAGDWLSKVLTPGNWFGILVIGINMAAVFWLVKLASVKWPVLGHFKTVAIVALGLILALMLGLGCN